METDSASRKLDELLRLFLLFYSLNLLLFVNLCKLFSMPFSLSVASVVQVFDFVDSDEPVLRRVSFFESVQLEVFVADLCVANSAQEIKDVSFSLRMVGPSVQWSAQNELLKPIFFVPSSHPHSRTPCFTCPIRRVCCLQ